MNTKQIILPLFIIILFSSLGCKHFPFQIGKSKDGFLRFEIDPPQAKVFVDGIYVGKAKDFSEEDLSKKEKFLRVLTGNHTVRFELDGYKTAEIEVHADNSVQTVSLKLEPL